MIETIFYFANSKAEYDVNANSGNISARTISFVPTGNGVGDIYKNGVKYGSSIDEDELIRIINEKIADGNFNIPFASTTKAGIIKLGKGLKSVGNDGTVDVDFTGLDNLDGIDDLIESIIKRLINKDNTGVVVTPRSLSGSTVAIADIKVGNTTKTIYAPVGSNNQNDPVNPGEGLNYAITDFSSNGTMLTISQNNNTNKSVNIENAVKQSIQNFIDNGDTIINNFGEKTQVSVNPTLTSGVQIATITVDGTTKTLYSPVNPGGEPGTGGDPIYIENPYDDTDIKNAISDLQNRADETEEDLNDLLNETEENVRNKFKNAFNTYKDLIDYYKNSGDTTPSLFTFGKEDADTWASQMGLITPNGDGTYNVGWSTLTQTYNSLAGEVAQIKANQSAGGEIDYEALAAGLYAYVDENSATSGMDSTWGKFVTTDDDSIQMLEWMLAAIKTYASNQEAYSRLLAAAKDYDENGDTIQEGIARINAFVEKDSNGDYVAGSSLSSMINKGVNNSLSEIFTENSSNSAVAGLYSRLRTAEDDATGAHEAISGLLTTVDSKLAKADLVSAITNKKDLILSSAGFASSASLEAARASLSSQIDGVSASVETCVKKDSNGRIESGVTLNADNIYLDGKTWAELINAEQIVAKQLESLNIKTSELEVFGNGTKLSINGTNGILLEGQSSNPYHFDIDGSGQFANGAISWDSFGNISFGSKFISAANANLSVDSLEAGSQNKVYVDSSNGVYVDGTCDSKINPDGSGYLGGNAITWETNGSGSIANGAITWGASSGSFSDINTITISGGGVSGLNVIDTDFSSGYETSVYGGEIDLTYGGQGANLRGTGLRVGSYEYTSTGPQSTSDMRKKDVIENENISIESIAEAPLFKYRMKDYSDGPVQIGSSAQYWQNLVPEAVSSDEEGYLRMNYITLNTVASLTSAKEIVKLKEENTTLKQRVEALEARLQLIENKLNA